MRAVLIVKQTSNIIDSMHIGVEGTLTFLMPLLKTVIENRHATLISCYMTSVDDLIDALQRKDKKAAFWADGYEGSVEHTIAGEKSLFHKFMGDRTFTTDILEVALLHVRDGDPIFHL